LNYQSLQKESVFMTKELSLLENFTAMLKMPILVLECCYFFKL
jgi:hypothetical protein